MKEFEIKNLVAMVAGDILVDVDIRFKEISPVDSVEAKLAKQKIDADLGALAFKLKQQIKDEVKAYFQ